MLSLSTKGRYATRAMLELALRNPDVPVRLKDIAKTQKISEKYLSRLMIILVSAGLVHSQRGKNGGYTLVKPSSEISIMDILLPMEGPIAPTHCLDDIKSCAESDHCVTREIWMKTQDTLTLLLKGITLRDMVNRYWEKQNLPNGMNPII